MHFLVSLMISGRFLQMNSDDDFSDDPACLVNDFVVFAEDLDMFLGCDGH